MWYIYDKYGDIIGTETKKAEAERIARLYEGHIEYISRCMW